MTKALSDDWMIDHEFVDDDIIKKKRYENWWAEKRVCDLNLNTPLTISRNVRCKDAIALLKREGFDMVPVIDEEGDVVGVVTEGNMSSTIISGRASPDATVMDAGVIYKKFKKLSMNARLADLATALDMEPYGETFDSGVCYCQWIILIKVLINKILPLLTSALIVTEQRCFATRKRKRTVSHGCEGDVQAGDKSAEAKDQMEVVTKSVVCGIVTRIDLLEFISHGGTKSEF
jgi:CBS domain-containing protein